MRPTRRSRPWTSRPRPPPAALHNLSARCEAGLVDRKARGRTEDVVGKPPWVARLRARMPSRSTAPCLGASKCNLLPLFSAHRNEICCPSSLRIMIKMYSTAPLLDESKWNLLLLFSTDRWGWAPGSPSAQPGPPCRVTADCLTEMSITGEKS